MKSVTESQFPTEAKPFKNHFRIYFKQKDLFLQDVFLLGRLLSASGFPAALRGLPHTTLHTNTVYRHGGGGWAGDTSCPTVAVEDKEHCRVPAKGQHTTELCLEWQHCCGSAQDTSAWHLFPLLTISLMKRKDAKIFA